nr:PqqD family protein [Eubacterium sp.]
MKKQTKNNYLEYVPVHNPDFPWSEDSDELVTVHVKNKGVMNRLAQKFLKKPKISQVHLDKYGSFIWKQIDGSRTVLEIAELADRQFGEELQPLYERLCTYVAQLEQVQFITIIK